MLSTSFRFKAKLRGRDGEFPYPLCSSPMINTPHHRGTFIPTDEPALTHRHPPESTVHVRAARGGVYSVGLDNDTCPPS